MAATLTVSPTPVPANSTIIEAGCGYDVDALAGILLGLTTPDGTVFSNNVAPDADGCFSVSASVFGAGAYRLVAHQYLHGTHHATLMAEVSFTIQ